jgi:cysteine desulfurase/selenocysteine lyase
MWRGIAMKADYIVDFPILHQQVNGHKLVYLDNAATTQKPTSVLKKVDEYYRLYNANAHRGVYYLSQRATELYNQARSIVKTFIGANKDTEIVFTKNATEGFNLLAYSYGMHFIEQGDEIVISIAEHHSNLVVWQQVAKAKGATLKYLYLDDECQISAQEIEAKITNKTKIVAITHVSNVLGIINPIEAVINKAHSVGAVVIIDVSQSIPHMTINVNDMGADFVVFSGHKMLAPQGIGVLYGKEALLEKMPPFMFGGDMIEYVYEQETHFAKLPYKFEAGTQNVGAAAGLIAAIDYLNRFEMNTIQALEKELISYLIEQLDALPYVIIYGTKDISKKTGVLSFNIEGIPSKDIAQQLDSYGVAIRSGHHCAYPLIDYMHLDSTCRISLYLYNTREEIDIFLAALKEIKTNS